MSAEETYRQEITQHFYNAWTSLGNGIPVSWPKREFNETGVDRYVRFNVIFVNENRTTVGGVTNYYDQSGLVVIEFYSSVGDKYSIADDVKVVSDIKDIFRDLETTTTRFVSPTLVDGPTDTAPFSQTNITFNWIGTLSA